LFCYYSIEGVGVVFISFGIVKSIALLPFFKFLGKW